MRRMFQNHLNRDKDAGGTVDNERIEATKYELKRSLKKLYDLSDSEEEEAEVQNQIQSVIEAINMDVGSMGICAKTLNYGEVAWRCMDCEKDPTCIICSSCFEKSDHTGHRVQLKRNVGGCCDCGDPEAWDPEHFCSDHKGYETSPEEKLDKLPKQIKESATEVFTNLCKKLKLACLGLQSFVAESKKVNMDSRKFKATSIQVISLILEFLNKAVDDVPAFLYIVDQQLNNVFFDAEFFEKYEKHYCCTKCFATDHEQKKYEQKLGQLKLVQRADFCTCSVLDLLLQTNNAIDDPTRKLVYDFLFKLFQSYNFKQCLTLSFGANYEAVMDDQNLKDDNHHISSISVQVLTSSEMAMIILSHNDLIDNILRVFDKHMQKFAAKVNENQRDRDDEYCGLWRMVHDLKYIARKDCMQYCFQNTTVIQQVIKTLSRLYLCDSKAPRTSMVMYMQDGACNDELLNIELTLIKVLNLYLREVKHDDIALNQSILEAFLENFIHINQELLDEGKGQHGIYCTPIHRCFSYYFTRLILFNYFDANLFIQEKKTQSVQNVFRIIFNANLPKQYQQKDQQSQGDEVHPLFQGGAQLADKIAMNDDFGSSLVDPVQPEIDIDMPQQSSHTLSGLLKRVLKTQIQQLSFIHEISAKKWVLSGEYLEHYPVIYYKIPDKLAFQDFASFQMILGMENETVTEEPLMDYVINNFGLDDQLQTLFGCLKTRSLAKANFKKFGKFDAQKLRLQLILFLRFLAQLCVHEVAYLKQIYNQKEEKAEQESKNSPTIKAMWSKAMKKEAVHLLLLNKVNVNIQTLKEKMVEIFAKDNVFEDALFEVTTQSRDMKNQVTFKLKEEYYGYFDPFQYVLPDQHSQIFQMYEQNQLRDKYADQGLNDLVGDYMGNYKFVSELNTEIAKNLARSEIVAIIIPLLQNWLMYRKAPPAIDPNDDFGVGENKRGNAALPDSADVSDHMSGLLQQMFQQSTANADNGDAGLLSSLGARLQKQFSGPKDGELDEISEVNVKSAKGLGAINQVVLSKFVDPSVASHCLKILILVINSGQTQNLAAHLNQEFIQGLVEWKNDSEVDVKTKNVLKFVLQKLQHIKPEFFNRSSTVQEDEEIDLQKQEETKTEKAKQTLDKEKLKKRQAKMMKKMVAGGGKFLKSKNQSKATEVQEEDESKEEFHQCAFCTEDLHDDNFIKNPYGNFVYCQSSKLMYHSIQQTLASQSKALKNEDLAAQHVDEGFGEQIEEQKYPDPAEKEFHDFQSLIERQIDEQTRNNLSPEQFATQFQADIQKLNAQSQPENLQLLPLVRTACNGAPISHEKTYSANQSIYNTYLNNVTGAASVINNCRHHAHLDCLRKYHLQQASLHEGAYQKQISGFSFGEFACPICKSINNSILPSKSLAKVAKDLPDVCDLDKSEIVVQDRTVLLLDFYMDVFSRLIKTQQGFVQGVYKNLQHDSTVLKDFRLEPQRLLSSVLDHFLHRINLVDVKGIKDFVDRDVTDILSKLHGSLNCLLRISSIGKHSVFETSTTPADHEDMIKSYLQSLLAKDLNSDARRTDKDEPLFSKNICLSAQRCLLVSGLLFRDSTPDECNKSISDILSVFYPILRLQFLLAMQWRKNCGNLRTAPYSTLKELSDFQITIGKDEHLKDTYSEIEIQSMRKLLVTVNLLKQTYAPTAVDGSILKRITEQTSDQEELDIIYGYLGLQQQSSSDLEQLPENPWSGEEQISGMEFYDAIDVEMVNQSPKENEAVGDVEYRELDLDNDAVLFQPSSSLEAPKQVPQIAEEDSNNIFGEYKSRKYIERKLEEFANQVSTNQNGNRLSVIRMPDNLKLMTPNFEFSLADLPEVFLDLQQIYYKKKCVYCDQERQDSATCLLCGETMCWPLGPQGKCTGYAKSGRANVGEGLLSYHARVHEGGSGIFIQLSTGNIILIQNGSSCQYETPYRNKYGELANPHDKRWDSFKIDQQGGGIDGMRAVRKLYQEFTVGNTILSTRTNPDTKFKVYLKNAL